MTRFEYRITRHSADEFTELVYFCSPSGQCNVERIPKGQIEKVQEILNEQGQEGWEAFQVAFGKDGIMIFWKRTLSGATVDEGD